MKKILVLLLSLCTINLMFSCKSDDDPFDYAKDIVGTYVGDLTVTIQGQNPVTLNSQEIVLAHASLNKVTITLKNFSISDGQQIITLGDVVVNDIPVQSTDGTKVTLVSTSVDVMIKLGPAQVKVKVSVIEGNIQNKKISFKIKVETPLPNVGSVNVDFVGDIKQ